MGRGEKHGLGSWICVGRVSFTRRYMDLDWVRV